MGLKMAKKMKQHPRVIWLYGLSGSGKSTLARALREKLSAEDFLVTSLDGDQVRGGLNRDLGFSDADRRENIRRIAEVSKLFLENGFTVINSFITPLNDFRKMAREIVGAENFVDVYLKCSYETCARRDPKGLYAKVQAGDLKQFTGRDSSFEEPAQPALIVDTETNSLEESLEKVYSFVRPLIEMDS